MGFKEESSYLLSSLEREISRLEVLEFQPGVGGGGWNFIGDSGHLGTVASYTFSSIPQTYLHLALITYARSSIDGQNDVIVLDINGAGSSNALYFYGYAYWDNSGQYCGVSGTRFSMCEVIGNSATYSASNVLNAAIGIIPYYARTDRFPTMYTRFGQHETDYPTSIYSRGGLFTAIYRSLTNVSSIGIDQWTGPNWVAGSRFLLYGIGGA